ncbi:hypothetical protein [Halobacillus naozhouensis]|uniref:YpzI-like protein n=1 Tax=Halobacillus naozhouensis TaxID=554880 RepID=A0ABY8J103_9BACI|nr:hypothetical protein [Halobacillus naozhouensis]WFT74571.1 hypothetical protein P9989_19815 [Halobacillus naozhouensis]
MSKRSKSKRTIQKGKDAVQPATGEERITISKSGRELSDKKE